MKVRFLLILLALLLITLPASGGQEYLTSSGGELDSKTYTLTGSVQLDDDVYWSVPQGSDTTIDLNGYTLTGSNGPLFYNQGSLTFKDDSAEKTGKIISGNYPICEGNEPTYPPEWDIDPDPPVIPDPVKVPEKISVVPLPEDGIGAYRIDPESGQKEYLLFQTYEICMQWLGDDAKCRDSHYCYGKDSSGR